ncbi:hypothetical protein GCM10028819_09680 [Spirosoma humi]
MFRQTILFLLLGATVAAQTPTLTPVTLFTDQLVAVYNTGDSINFKTYFASITTDQAQITANSRRMQREFAQIGPVQLKQSTRLSPVQTELLLKANTYDSWWKLVVLTDSTNHFREHHMWPVRLSNEGLGSAKLTQTQILTGIDSYITKLLAKNVFAGNVLIAHNNQIIYSKSFGNNPQGSPNTEGQQFNLASLGKLFTSISILQLVDSGKLSLNDSVGKFMPELKNKALHPITIRQLLTHTSGMGDFFDDPAYQPQTGKVITQADFLPAIEKDKPHFRPGTAFRYSNTGFLLLGLLIEKVTGSSFADFVTKNILLPAGMHHTLIDSGAGGGLSTSPDMYTLAQAIQKGKLLKKSTLERFLTEHTPDWGLGQEYQALGAEVVTGHSGGYIGVCTELNMYRHSGYTVIILSNTEPPYGHFLSDKIKELIIPNELTRH